jgi:Peptidase family M28
VPGAADSAGAGELGGGAGTDIRAQLAAMPPLDPATLRRDVERLAALGPRFAGTEGEERGRAFVREVLAATLPGAVHEEPFDHLAYRPEGASCQVLGSDLALPCAGLQSTAAGVVEAEAIYVGAGDDATIEMLERGTDGRGEGPAIGGPMRQGGGVGEDVAAPNRPGGRARDGGTGAPAGGGGAATGASGCGRGAGGPAAEPGRHGAALAGRIAVVRSGVPMTVVPALVECGVAGVVVIGGAPDGLVQHFTAAFYPPPLTPPWEGRVLSVPGVTVEAEAGERLLALLSAGPTRLRLEHGAAYETATSANLVAEIPGTDPDAAHVVVGAHYDTQLESPGAADNATGLAALLGIARAWAGLQPLRTIELVAFGVEEPAAWGASHFVARRDPESIAAMVNLDALGPPIDATRTIVADANMAPLAAESAAATGWEVEQQLDARDFPYADHAPFIAASIPAAWIWRYPPPHPYYHSSGDTPRWVNFTRLAEDAAASAFTAFRLATTPAVDLR